MKERPILFSGPMVRALLDGTKTQTRRILRLPDGAPSRWHGWKPSTVGGSGVFANGDPFLEQACLYNERTGLCVVCPHGTVGDRLWVRETCWVDRDTKKFAWYAHQDIFTVDPDRDNVRRRSAIHMPRADARLFLEITAVRAERLQDMSEEDALAEGVRSQVKHSAAFADLWDKINGDRAGQIYRWQYNPWVWVITFKLVTP